MSDFLGSVKDTFKRHNPFAKKSPQTAANTAEGNSVSVTNPMHAHSHMRDILPKAESSEPKSEDLGHSTMNPLFAAKHSKMRDVLPPVPESDHESEHEGEGEHGGEHENVSPQENTTAPKPGLFRRGLNFLGRGIVKGGKGLWKGLSFVGGEIASGARAAGKGIASAARATGKGVANVARAAGKGIASAARVTGREIAAGATFVGKKMGIGLNDEEKKTAELKKANPNFDERFGTDKRTNEIIAGVGAGAGIVGAATGVGLVAGNVIKNTDATQLNASGAGSALGGALGIGLGAMGIKAGSDRLDRAKASGDHAGKSLAIDQIATNSVGLTKGAISAASAGVKFAAAANPAFSAAKGVVAGLGAATGALTIAEGLFKGGIDAKHLHKTRTYVPVSKKGIDWRSHIVKKKAWRVGINALKVIGGALGVAGSVMTGGAAAIGLTAASAAIGIGSSVVKMGKGIANRRKIAAQRKEMFPDAGAGGKAISKTNIDNANKLRSNAKVSKTGSIANEMIEAVKKFDEGKYKSIQSVHIVSQETPSIKDKIASVLTWGAPRAQAKENKEAVKVKNAEAKEQLTKFDENDKEVYDANEILSAIGVSREEATSASGQELIEKKVSVTNSL